MNGDELPVGNGGPLRMRLPRQLGYKNVKFITHLTVTDNLKGFGKGSGLRVPEGELCLVRRHLTGLFRASGKSLSHDQELSDLAGAVWIV